MNSETVPDLADLFKHPAGPPKPILSRRVVAFVDILGFKSAIREVSEASALNMLGALKQAEATEREIYDPAQRGNLVLTKREGRELTSFSDSVVISDSESGEYGVLTLAGSLAVQLLSRGFICRGGVAVGNDYHKARILFGTGLISAVEIEKHVAKYPRIVVEPAVARNHQKHCKQLAEKLRDGHAADDLLKSDADGCWFIDLFSKRYLPYFLASDEVEIFLEKVRCFLQRILSSDALAANQCLRTRAKYFWLAEQFNQSVKQNFSAINPVVL